MHERSPAVVGEVLNKPIGQAKRLNGDLRGPVGWGSVLHMLRSDK
jgi:hypothetical protein